MNQNEISSLAHELGFWKDFVKTSRFLNGWVANIPTPELHQETRDIVKRGIGSTGKVLDVGSGVVSILRGSVPDHQLVAADPLSPLYQLIFDYARHGITPPLPLAVEDIRPDPKYDVIHISNALDHATYPPLGIAAMQDALVTGGILVVCGFINESTHMDGAGMHQWDFDLGPAHTLELRRGPHNVPAGFLEGSWKGNVSYRKTLSVDGREWLIWIWQKP